MSAAGFSHVLSQALLRLQQEYFNSLQKYSDSIYPSRIGPNLSWGGWTGYLWNSFDTFGWSFRWAKGAKKFEHQVWEGWSGSLWTSVRCLAPRPQFIHTSICNHLLMWLSPTDLALWDSSGWYKILLLLWPGTWVCIHQRHHYALAWKVNALARTGAEKCVCWGKVSRWCQRWEKQRWISAQAGAHLPDLLGSGSYIRKMAMAFQFPWVCSDIGEE